MTLDERLKIVMVDSHSAIERGGAIQCVRLAIALAEHKHQVTCVFDEPSGEVGCDGDYWQSLHEAGVEVRRYRLGSPRAMRAFRNYLASASPQIVHTHKNRALHLVAGATVGRRDFGWVANRGTDYSLWPGSPAWLIHRWSVDRIIAVADAVRDKLIRNHIPAGKVQTIYGSFEASRFNPAVACAGAALAWDIPAGVPIVGMAASFCSRKKGQADFLKAAAMVLREHPSVHFVLAGDGPAGSIKQLAADLGILSQVRFPGFVSNMPAALLAFDVVVCASIRGEGLTGSIREALAMARPVVSTDVAGNRELVRDGETGLLAPAREPLALAAAISSLLANPTRAAKLGEAGRELVLALCTDEVRTAQVEQLYRKLTLEKRQSTCHNQAFAPSPGHESVRRA